MSELMNVNGETTNGEAIKNGHGGIRILEKEEQLEESVREILRYINEDPEREGLKDTPARFRKFLNEFTNPDPITWSTFKNESVSHEMILQKEIPFYSLCEHHLVPFFGFASVAYIPGATIIGLSKLARVVDLVARAPQNQERITQQIARLIEKNVPVNGVAVKLTARHLCMEMRGIEKPGVETTTFCYTGLFRETLAQRRFEVLTNK